MTTKAIKQCWTFSVAVAFFIAALIFTGVFFSNTVNADDGGAGTEGTGCGSGSGGVCNPDPCL